VATFQKDAYRRMLERAGMDAKNSADRAVGEVDGVPCALARIGIGAPAAALLLEDSVARGVRSVLVVGSAGSLQRHLPIGSTVIVTGAEREDGTSHHYLPAGEIVSADPELIAASEECSVTRGATSSSPSCNSSKTCCPSPAPTIRSDATARASP